MLSEFRQLLSEDEIRAKITTIMMKHDKEDEDKSCDGDDEKYEDEDKIIV